MSKHITIIDSNTGSPQGFCVRVAPMDPMNRTASCLHSQGGRGPLVVYGTFAEAYKAAVEFRDRNGLTDHTIRADCTIA